MKFYILLVLNLFSIGLFANGKDKTCRIDLFEQQKDTVLKTTQIHDHDNKKVIKLINPCCHFPCIFLKYLRLHWLLKPIKVLQKHALDCGKPQVAAWHTYNIDHIAALVCNVRNHNSNLALVPTSRRYSDKSGDGVMIRMTKSFFV